MAYDYNFGVPGVVVWAFHILFGIFLIYLSYMFLEGKCNEMNKYVFVLLMCIGVLAILYHSHLWYVHRKELSV
jgi:hypothetical protein